jgi:hypothetical protein
LKALPTAPLAVLALVIVGTGLAAAIVIVKVAEPVPVPFVALIVTLLVPAAEGVPEITPVLVLTLRPAGRPVAL